MLWTCKRWTRLLGPYSENALPEGKAARLAAHLAVCSSCRAELTTLRRMAHLLREHKPAVPEPAGDLWSRIHAEIAPARPVAASRSLAWAVPAAALAALILFLLARPWTARETASSPREATAPAPATSPVTGKIANARPLLAPSSRPDPFALLPERGTTERNHAEDGRTRVASASGERVRARMRAPRRARIRSRMLVAVKERETAPTPPPALDLADRASGTPLHGSETETKTEEVRSAPDSGGSALGAEARTPSDSAEPETTPQPPVVTAVAAGMSPMPHVSAADSAVDEALDAQRQRELFRYSLFSRR